MHEKMQRLRPSSFHVVIWEGYRTGTHRNTVGDDMKTQSLFTYLGDRYSANSMSDGSPALVLRTIVVKSITFAISELWDDEENWVEKWKQPVCGGVHPSIASEFTPDFVTWLQTLRSGYSSEVPPTEVELDEMVTRALINWQ
jgi:hypothetical protein